MAEVDGLTLISHAGGGLPEGVYSNSLQAFEAAHENGIRIFEVDLVLSGDGHVILLHDREAAMAFWHPSGLLPAVIHARLGPTFPRPDRDAFLAGRMTGGLTPLDLEGLCRWALAAGDVSLVLDLKDGPETMLPYIERVPDECRAMMIPQVWTPDEYREWRDRGFERVAVTIYASALAASEIEEFLADEDPWFMVMPVSVATPDTIQSVISGGDRLIIHTVNLASLAESLRDLGVDGVMTDSLVPRRAP